MEITDEMVDRAVLAGVNSQRRRFRQRVWSSIDEIPRRLDGSVDMLIDKERAHIRGVLEAALNEPRQGKIRLEDISGIRLEVAEVTYRPSMTLAIFIQVDGEDMYRLPGDPTLLAKGDDITISLPNPILEIS